MSINVLSNDQKSIVLQAIHFVRIAIVNKVSRKPANRTNQRNLWGFLLIAFILHVYDLLRAADTPPSMLAISHQENMFTLPHTLQLNIAPS